MSVQFFFIYLQEKEVMALYREQLEPYMYSEKRRKRKSYKWAKKQMNKWLRIKNKKINAAFSETNNNIYVLVENSATGLN